MNDRFTFRCWDKEETKFININHYGISLAGGVLDRFDGRLVINEDNYIIQQCTGLRDSADKLIYEGDELYTFHSSMLGPSQQHTGEIKFKNGKFIWEDENLESDYPVLELYGITSSIIKSSGVIGNIFEGVEK